LIRNPIHLRPSLLVLFATLAWVGTGCHRAPPPNVLIVVLDTVRADRLSAYGYPKETSPRLEALAAEGRLYERAYSTSSWTAPAHASLFTGLYPAAHRTTQENWTLSAELVTLAEVFAAHGYETVGIVSNPMLSTERGFDQGFQRYHPSWSQADELRRQPNWISTREVERFLFTRAVDRPFFAFVNLNGAHSPYDSCGPECDRWVVDREIAQHSSDWHAYYLGRREPNPADLAHIGQRYDAELRRVDAFVGKIIDSLEQTGVLDDTIVVVTSDHGENLGDHGHVDHVFTLYESTTRIPLIVRFPRAFEPGTRDALPAQLPDVHATLLALTGFAEEAPDQQGVDLRAPRARADRPLLLEYAKPVQSLSIVRYWANEAEQRRLERWNRSLGATIDRGYKLIVASDGERELYDLRSDPDETKNLIGEASEAGRIATLTRRLDELRTTYAEARVAPAEPAPLEEETRRALEAIGYLEE